MGLDITRRGGWGSRQGRGGYAMGRVDHVIIHHFYRPDVPASASAATERSVMRGVESYHAGLGWSAAPGYQWVVFDSGRVYEGVGYGRRGVHTAGLNSSAVAVCFAIDGDAANATPEAWEAAYDIIQLGVAHGHVGKGYRISGHTDHAAKSCPGGKVHPHIGKLRTGDLPDVGDGGDSMGLPRYGQQSMQVRELQQGLWDWAHRPDLGAWTSYRLSRCGMEKGRQAWIDGKFGDWVRDALIYFQRDNWLHDDGKVTVQGLARLEAKRWGSS